MASKCQVAIRIGLKEAIHIHWEKPTLNHQLYHVNLKLSL